MPGLSLAILAALILLNGYFAMAELAVVSSRRPRLTAMAEAGSKGARAALRLLENQARFLSSVQIGITLVGVLAGAFGGATLAEDLAAPLQEAGLGEGAAESVAVAIVVAVITYLSLIVGELVPKQIALANPERVASLVAGPMTTVARIAAPAVWLLEVSSALVLRLLGRGQEAGQVVTEEEIRALIAEGESAGVVEPQERRMIARVMRLGDRSVRGVMTPRPEVDWLDLDQDTPTILARLHRSPHSRLPAARGGIDHAVGVIHARDVLHALVGGEEPDLAALVRQPPVIHDRADALDALGSAADLAGRHGLRGRRARHVRGPGDRSGHPGGDRRPVRDHGDERRAAGRAARGRLLAAVRLAAGRRDGGPSAPRPAAEARLPHGGRLRARPPRPVPEARRQLRDGEAGGSR